MMEKKKCKVKSCKREYCYYEQEVITPTFCENCLEETNEIYFKSKYSSAINEFIRNIGELLFYEELQLEEQVVNGRPCLIRTDLRFDVPVTLDGLTNKELIDKNKSPRDAETECQVMRLHHIGQKPDSPFAELTKDEDLLYKGNAIHYPESTMIDRRKFSKERNAHWRARLEKTVVENIEKSFS